MKILLIYPLYPDTFWSYKHALTLMSKKALLPPLGLLTVAAMLPDEWEKKLIDLNVTDLTDEDILWADYVFISAMTVQRESVKEVINRCNKHNRKIVAGGPLFTTEYENFDGVSHFVLGEAEVTLSPFLSDLAQGCAKRIYASGERPDLSNTPLPLWSLLNMKHYSSMNVQYSRGCPFDCDFCDIPSLYGHRPRVKNTQQVVNELEALYSHGWRSGVFFVDDNFIGNRKKLKSEMLPAMIEWAKKRKFPFNYMAESSIDLADDEELMQLMLEAGFNRAFIGIETPNEESLAECHKLQNKGRDLVASVRKMQSRGLEVQGGFIIGFDNDPVSIFKSQIDFIQESGIVTAMVGLLNALHGTRLYDRLKSENRLLREPSGDNVDCSMNFIPKMKYETLISGYKHVLDTIYSPKYFNDRIWMFYQEYRPQRKQTPKLKFYYINWFIKSIWFLGIVGDSRRYFWKLLISTLFRYPRFLLLSIRFSARGLHFRRIARKTAQVPDVPSQKLVPL